MNLTIPLKKQRNMSDKNLSLIRKRRDYAILVKDDTPMVL